MVASLAAQRIALLGAVLLFAISSAHAQSSHIGNTPVARNDVQGTLVTGVVTVHVGDDVFRDEGMHTGDNSEARIVFLDDTNVSLGPNSNLKLDKFVYSDQGAQAIAINVSKGVFRFVTGKGDHNAYKINTPFATIGVRGTEFDIKTTDNSTLVHAIKGRVIVCELGGRRRCVELDHRDQQVRVTRGGGLSTGTGPSPFEAETGCTGGLCDTSTFAANQLNHLQQPSLASSPPPQSQPPRLPILVPNKASPSK
jgi:ferric-dicitrate binding protein FerR (iron transport regulator)